MFLLVAVTWVVWRMPEDGTASDGWRPMETAPRDGRVVRFRYRAAIGVLERDAQFMDYGSFSRWQTLEASIADGPDVLGWKPVADDPDWGETLARVTRPHGPQGGRR